MINKEIRVILDTNLWISFLISKDFSKLDQLIYQHKIQLIFSQELLEEFIEVCQRPKLKKYFSTTDIQNIIETIDEFALFIEVKSNVDFCRDSKDNFLLNLAIDGKVDFLITGDFDLLDLKKIDKTIIISISEFLKL